MGLIGPMGLIRPIALKGRTLSAEKLHLSWKIGAKIRAERGIYGGVHGDGVGDKI